MTESWAESLILAGSGVLGAFVRGALIRGQRTFGYETFQDVILAGFAGFFWTVQVGGWWPPFDLPVTWTLTHKAVFVAGFCYLSIESLKRLLLRCAPRLMERLNGGPHRGHRRR